MDCGPAALKALLEGFGVRVSYGRIREACQTDVDGTSVDTLEDLLNEFGLDAEQVLVPIDHVLLPGMTLLPALVVTRLPSGQTHFVVAWRRVGRFILIMDPAAGRLWVSVDDFLRDLFLHGAVIPSSTWREFAASAGFARALTSRLGALGVSALRAEHLIVAARSDPGWRSLAALDAACRMVRALVETKAVARGEAAARMCEALSRNASADPTATIVPERFWSARLAAGGDEEHLVVAGAVVVHVRGRRATDDEGVRRSELPSELVAALDEPTVSPWRVFAGLLWRETRAVPLALAAIVLVTSFTTILETLVFRGVVDVAAELTVDAQRIGAAVALVLFGAILLGIDLGAVATLQAVARRLETALRVEFLEKIPRLGLRYFRSRPSSDMTERAHSIQRVRAVPELAAEIIRTAAALVATTIGILLVDPHGFLAAAVAVAVSFCVPMATRAVLSGLELRLRTHGAALLHFVLDAQLGLVPIRTHGAERALRLEHEQILVEWRSSGRSLVRAGIATDAIGALAGTLVAAWILLDYVASHTHRNGVLLVAYWALSLAPLGQRLAMAIRQYPAVRNVALRLAEPLGAPDEFAEASAPAREPRAASAAIEAACAVGVRFDGVTARGGGHVILEGLDLEVAAGEHVAIVGASGAGKSSILGLLLGLLRPSEGALLVDGIPLDGERVVTLRERTAWVDPAVRLWNGTLLSNLLYGAGADLERSIADVVEASELREPIERLPEGMQSVIGEAGALLSGGEGQRARFARALCRKRVGLALLDEPFRGLDAASRSALLVRARAYWADATMLCVTHDVSETIGFERVLVVEGGRIVEDGRPKALSADASSRYASLLSAERALREETWGGSFWRRLQMTRGELVGRGERP